MIGIWSNLLWTQFARSHKYRRASQIYEQHDTWNEVERIQWNQNQQHMNVVFNPYQATFNYNVEIDYSLQKIVTIGPTNDVCQYWKVRLKMKLLDFVKYCIKPLVPSPELPHSFISGNRQDSKHFVAHIQQNNNYFRWTLKLIIVEL